MRDIEAAKLKSVENDAMNAVPVKALTEWGKKTTVDYQEKKCQSLL